MNRVLSLALIFFASSYFQTSHACSCAKLNSFEQAVTEAKVVVLAKLESVKNKEEKPKFLSSLEGSFSTIKLLKGELNNVFKATTGYTSAACGIPFKTGKTYLILSDGKNWRIGACGYSRAVEENQINDLSTKIKRIIQNPKQSQIGT